MKLWASTTIGLEPVAAAEVARKIDVVPGSVAVHQGHISFELPAGADGAAIAEQLCSLRTCEYLYAFLLSTKLPLECSTVAALEESGGAGSAVGLEAIRQASATIAVCDVHAATQLCARMATQLTGSTALRDKIATPEMAHLRFRAFGRRGGKHGFSSDDAKRMAAAGLAQIKART